MACIDTHAHLDGEEFSADLPAVIDRAKAAGVAAIFIPGINASSVSSVGRVCQAYPDYCFPMIGLQPEEVRPDWRDVLTMMKRKLDDNLEAARQQNDSISVTAPAGTSSPLEQVEERRYIAIGECGLDFYWSREYEQEQLAAFEEQVRWSVETRLPLMIHCRKAQGELLHILRRYEKDLPGGVFHCFTGNQQEAREYLRFERFCLGIGGVSTFKSSHLREDLPAAVPLDRIVLETDSPYMAPVPHRGKRNESAFVTLVRDNLAQCYGVTPDEIDAATNRNVRRIFGPLPLLSNTSSSADS